MEGDAQRTLDAEAVGVLRDQAYNGWHSVEKAVEADQTDTLGPALFGALRLARRDVMAAWLDRDAQSA